MRYIAYDLTVDYKKTPLQLRYLQTLKELKRKRAYRRDNNRTSHGKTLLNGPSQ